MNYADIRRHIESGDVLGVRGVGLFPDVIRAVQYLSGQGDLAGITHVGIAWWIEGRLYSVEMDGRHNVLRPLSQHIKDGCSVKVYRCPVLKEAVYAQFNRAISNPVHYDYLDLLTIGMRMLLRLRSTDDGDGDGEMVCSTYVPRWLQWAGWKAPASLPAMPSPSEVCGVLGEAVFSISPGEQL